MKVKIDRLCSMASRLPRLGELELLIETQDTYVPLYIYHAIWRGHSCIQIGGEGHSLKIINYPSGKPAKAFETELKKVLKSYLGSKQKIIEVTQHTLSTTAFALEGTIEEVVREELVKYVAKPGNSFTIPENDNGNFSLAMLDQGYDIFYFESMSFDGKKLNFHGHTDESIEKLDISESDLPDKGLLYIYDYITTGVY
ncbi:hypothetical protein POZ03_01255 [Bacteroides uniformis]|uniref:hypothetical protein n=1 Tax=Bacteroides uniformis TaxID=820 RepID=UPI00233F29B1|nr:hypothetical protein [Bacteroides uniformis]MDC1809085.1 hypothetical protein [Bacteroides uniformis]